MYSLKGRIEAKPILKWAGGKTQLLPILDTRIPPHFDRYVEPFVGGGALFFHLQPERALISDSNPELVNLYRQIALDVEAVITCLKSYENTADTFYATRSMRWQDMRPCEAAARMIYLNRTCFNGLYRVNKAGLFNVPFGRYDHPQICDTKTINADSELLKNVEILTGDYQETLALAKGKTLFYFDPPYRPLNNTSSFNDYTKEAFNDLAQIRLKQFCDKVVASGYHFMLSNSDCPDGFFDDLYSQYNIEHVWASRSVNANASKRGKLTEILVHDYKEVKQRQLF